MSGADGFARNVDVPDDSNRVNPAGMFEAAFALFDTVQADSNNVEPETIENCGLSCTFDNVNVDTAVLASEVTEPPETVSDPPADVMVAVDGAVPMYPSVSG